MDEIDKLIDTIHINEANVERIAVTKHIDGRLRSEIRRVMLEHAYKEVVRAINELAEQVKIQI
jgi:hypothetical protein